MALNLTKMEKGSTLNLTKAAPALKVVKAILSWQSPAVSPAYDLDVSAFGLVGTPNGPKLLSDDWVVFFNQEQSPNGAIVKTPDQRAGGTEELIIDIAKLDPSITEISIVVTIDRADERGHTFGKVTDASIKIIDADTGDEIALYDLDEDFKTETAVQVGSFYKDGDHFSFAAIGAGYQLTFTDFYNGYNK